MSNHNNAVYGYNLESDNNAFPDNMKYAFAIYGKRKNILSMMEDMYAYLQERYPECVVLREEEDGTTRDMPVIDTTTLTEEKKVEMLNAAQAFYLDNKFTVGPVEVKTNRQWIFEAFGTTGDYAEDDFM